MGDGWDLSLGSITFDTTTDLFYLNGVGGLSEPLLCCDADSYGNHFFVPHLHPEIRILTSDGSTNPQTTGGCFYMRLPTGLTYELGCTTDSRRRRSRAGRSSPSSGMWTR